MERGGKKSTLTVNDFQQTLLMKTHTLINVNRFKTSIILFLTFTLVVSNACNQHRANINWPDFMEDQDLVFDSLGGKWEEGFFTGNGLLGTMCYRMDSNKIQIDIGRTDVYDNRKNSGGKPRLHVGYFSVEPAGKILNVSGRIDLWNAEAHCLIKTDQGEIGLRIITGATDDIILVDAKTSGNEKGYKWKWNPGKSIDPRTLLFPEDHIYYKPPPVGYKANPDPVLSESNNINICYQPMDSGGYTTAWKTEEEGDLTRYFVTIKYSIENNISKDQAFKILTNFGAKDVKGFIESHRNWWHEYYPQSYMSIADSSLEKFYWIQQYKLASATGTGKLMLDLQGPWTVYNTGWPKYWFNLNTQLTYSPLYTANRLNIAASLVEHLNKYSESLNKNVPSEYQHNSAAIGRSSAFDLKSSVLVKKGSTDEFANSSAETGNLTWLLLYYWKHYRYSMDDNILKELYPLLKRSINYYLHLIEKNEAGKYVFNAKTYSPEYGGGSGPKGYNTNYDLSLLRWGCETLLKANVILGERDTLASKWEDVLHNLIDYPIDENGYRISSDVPFSMGHRHYSHLLMIYPLYLVNWDDIESRPLIEKSIAHWLSLGAGTGYMLSGSASMYAMMGKGNEARDKLAQLLVEHIKPNTMYREGFGPVMETPPSAAASLQDLYLQYWNDIIRVFPAVPDDWKDATFHDFRTEGGFLISAHRQNRQTQWVEIKSTVGGEFNIKPNFNGSFKTSNKKISLTDMGNGVFKGEMPKGASLVLVLDERRF